MRNILHDLPIERLHNGHNIIVDDCVIVEQKITFYLNGNKLLSVMSLPQHQDAHLLGFLYSEGVISNIEDVTDLHVADDGLSVFAEAEIDSAALANLFSDKTLTSGCCVGISAHMNEESHIFKRFLDNHFSVTKAFLEHYLQLFEKPTLLFEKTGCVHKALLINEDGMLLCEDIGRHNAIDKVMGRAYLDGFQTKNAVLFVSGRLSLEMVTKALMHKICIVVSKAAVTFQAIKAAQDVGITLIGFARGQRLNIYTHSGRIADLYPKAIGQE